MADSKSVTASEKSDATESPAAKPAGSGAAGGGGFAAWLPLVLTIIAMPALAYAITTFFIVPQIQRANGQGAPAAAGAPSAAHGEQPAAHGAPGASTKGKHSVALNKMIVNVAGTMGTRYLLTSLTLVGGAATIKTQVEEHRDQLLDVATSTLSNKTIAELERPGARNQIRGELLGVFNTVLGDGAVNEIYITEFAIQ